jgi:hypothetical protein
LSDDLEKLNRYLIETVDPKRDLRSRKAPSPETLIANWLSMEPLKMKPYENRSRARGNIAVRNKATPARSPTQTVDWHRVDRQLDEELRDTFPASDALSVTRNPSERRSGGI